MKRTLPLYLILLFLPSCDPFALKPLDIQTVSKGARTARWFNTSSITTVHNHVEVKTKKGWVQVLETDGNVRRIYDVSIDRDTIVVKLVQGTLIYQLETIYWDYYVRLDSSVSEFEYDNKFHPRDKKGY